MKTMKQLFILIVLIGTTILFGCQKEPSACISVSPTTVSTGTSMSFKNCTTDGDHYKWTLPDGSSFTTKDMNYTFNVAGTKVVTLEAFSKNDKKHDVATVTITVNASPGGVSFWNTSSSYIINVTINSNMQQITTSVNPADCTTSGAANFSGMPGTYSYTATDVPNGGSSTWSGNVTITDKGCLRVQLL